MLQKGVFNSMTIESACLAGRNNIEKRMSYEVIVMRFIRKKLIKSPSLLTMTNELLSLTESTLWLMVTQTLKKCNYIMSYNELPNISVDSVTLPNKPLSNLEIIHAAKRLSLNGFRGVFLRETLPKRAKLNECGIFQLD